MTEPRSGVATAALVVAALGCVLLLQLLGHGSPASGGFSRLLVPQVLHAAAKRWRSASETGPAGLVSNLAYVADPAAAEKLGCPLDYAMACFYSFTSEGVELTAAGTGENVTEGSCIAIFRPLPSDHGRPWCIRQGKEPAWLADALPRSSWQTFKDPVLLTGKLDSPNPTHQANLHFLGIWRWMKRMQLAPGQLRMLVDHDDPSWAPGKYGAGLANALGSLGWLPSLEPTVHVFASLQFSIPDAELFPFDLKRLMLDQALHLDLLELAENVKHRVLNEAPIAAGASLAGVLSCGFGAVAKAATGAQQPARVLVAKRRDAETRVLENADELAASLRANYGLEAAVAVLGELTFEEQVRLVAAADVLVGVTGSDLISMMFLPLSGAVVEIFPALGREVVSVPELPNMARMLGRGHLSFVAGGNLTLDEGESRLLYRAKRVRVPVPDLAALVNLAAARATAGSAWFHSACSVSGAAIRCSSRQPCQQAPQVQ